MKCLYIPFFIFLLFNSPGFPQTLSKQGGSEVSSLDFIPVIFVPGIMGSPLYDDVNNNNQLTVDEKSWFGIKFLSSWLEENGIDPDGNYNIKVSPLRNDTTNNLRDELNTIPMDLYKGFFNNLEANGYILDNYDSNHGQGENLFCFTYDWRKNNTTNAQLLSDFIDSVRGWTGAVQVNLIGHSMGGTVSKKCISMFDKSRIDKMVFIGTPHLGAPEIITVMLKGKLFEWLNIVIADISVRSLARNLPSCYQLIPSINYFNLELRNNVSSGVEIYSQGFQIPNGSFTNYFEMIEYLKTYTSSFGETLNSILIDSAESFKESVSNVDFGEIQVFNIVGYNLPTIGKNRIKITPPFNLISVEEARILNGDFTVPLRSAEIINNQVFENTYYISGVIHSALPASQETLEILLGVFNNPPIIYFPQYTVPPSSYAAPPPNDVYNEKEIPEIIFISQNFPNPFNSTTTFEFQIPSLEKVTLKIYDMLGNEIATFVNEELPAGTYKYIWNANDLVSGVYFYQLQTKDFAVTRKLVLMK